MPQQGLKIRIRVRAFPAAFQTAQAQNAGKDRPGQRQEGIRIKEGAGRFPVNVGQPRAGRGELENQGMEGGDR